VQDSLFLSVANVGVLPQVARLRLEHMGKQPVLSRHRLPGIYRCSMAVLWLTPVFLLLLTAILGNGISPTVFDLRLMMPLIIMALPALYIWQEGVDVLPGGIRVRIHIPRAYPYEALDTYDYDARTDRHVLTVWDTGSRKVLECRAGHLTQFPILMASLKANLRLRNGPS
jgi:hypothetical protein